ncbi:hypothetical protein BN2127_JRS7_00321 [Bacillus subtilis]|nr:hypothetical protein BN2127_JRS7_00321 [Bacillus subtilis]
MYFKLSDSGISAFPALIYLNNGDQKMRLILMCGSVTNCTLFLSLIYLLMYFD